jgi:hypothetical protein
MPFTGDTFTHLFDWEKDPQRQDKIVDARLEAEFDGIDTGLSSAAVRLTAVETQVGAGLADNSVTNAKLANMAQATVKLRAAGSGTGDPIDGSGAQVAAIIGAASTAAQGVVELATNAEALGGSDSTRAVTSAGLASDKSLATPGYMKFPGGLIIQWGRVTPSSGTGTVTFPITFPNAVFSVVATITNAPTATNSFVVVGTRSITTSGFETRHRFQVGAGNGNGTEPADWIAIGN